MKAWQRIIKEETEKCRITYFPTEDGKGTYPYVITPLDYRLSSDFYKAAKEGMLEMLHDEIKKSDAIALPESKGFILAGVFAETGLDLLIIRKRDYRIEDQIEINQKKAYDIGGTKKMYSVGLRKNERVLLVDDFISSGGTEISIIKAFKPYCQITGIGSLYERGNGIEMIERETGYKAKGLARLEIIDGKPKITKFGI